MVTHASRPGFTLVEFILFIAICAFMGSVAIGMTLSTQDARIRQRMYAEVEQTGADLLLTMSRTIRRAEAVLDPPAGATGSVLTLQMGAPLEFPTVYASTSSGELLLIKRDDVSLPLNGRMEMENLVFRTMRSNGVTGVRFSFDLRADIPLPTVTQEYRKHFSTAVTLYPDDYGEAGGCGSCPAPSCSDNTYTWYYCLYETCQPTSLELSC